MTPPSYRDSWRRRTAEARDPHKIKTSQVASLLSLAQRVIEEQDAEIARLRSELDGYHGRTVLHCMDRDMDRACLASLDEPDGTILRATDTGRELVLADRTWLPR